MPSRELTISDGPVKHEIFTVFNGLWSDNADQMSLLYSSSRSLKTDFTRCRLAGNVTRSTGKRTARGAIDDGVNSVIRYFNNNFCDGYFEDCLNQAFARSRRRNALSCAPIWGVRNRGRFCAWWCCW